MRKLRSPQIKVKINKPKQKFFLPRRKTSLSALLGAGTGKKRQKEKARK